MNSFHFPFLSKGGDSVPVHLRTGSEFPSLPLRKNGLKNTLRLKTFPSVKFYLRIDGKVEARFVYVKDGKQVFFVFLCILQLDLFLGENENNCNKFTPALEKVAWTKDRTHKNGQFQVKCKCHVKSSFVTRTTPEAFQFP